jgi:hypothetical protein
MDERRPLPRSAVRRSTHPDLHAFADVKRRRTDASARASPAVASTQSVVAGVVARDEREQSWRRPAAAGRRLLVFVRCGTVICAWRDGCNAGDARITAGIADRPFVWRSERLASTARFNAAIRTLQQPSVPGYWDEAFAAPHDWRDGVHLTGGVGHLAAARSSRAWVDHGVMPNLSYCSFAATRRCCALSRSWRVSRASSIFA